MRKLTQVVLCMAALMATPAFAEMKIAVMNYQMALLESDAAKKYAVDAEKKFGPQLTKLKSLESGAKGIQDRLVKGGSKMAQGERERLELEFKQKARDFQFQSKELNEAKAIADRDMLKQLKPKLDKAVEEVIKKGNFDLVLERGAVVEVPPGDRVGRAQPRDVALVCDAPARAARARAEVDDVVGDHDRLGLVLDDEHRVALVAQTKQKLVHALDVVWVQPDGRFIENVENTLKIRAQLSRKPNALGFSPRESGGGAVEIEVIEAYFTKEGKALKDLGLNIPDDGGFAAREFDLGEKGFEVANGEGVDFWNRLPGKAN